MHHIQSIAGFLLVLIFAITCYVISGGFDVPKLSPYYGIVIDLNTFGYKEKSQNIATEIDETISYLSERAPEKQSTEKLLEEIIKENPAENFVETPEEIIKENPAENLVETPEEIIKENPENFVEITEKNLFEKLVEKIPDETIYVENIKIMPGPKPWGYDHHPLDTACSMVTKETLAQAGFIQKWPDVISVGCAKCGTGSLTFIDCHPNVTFRHFEPVYYQQVRPKEQRRLETYKIPLSPPGNILVEKSPGYMNGDIAVLSARAKMMKEDNPNVKIIIFLCDPVKRVYSHVRQIMAQKHIATKKNYTDAHALVMMNTILKNLPKTSYKNKLYLGTFEGVTLGQTVVGGMYYHMVKPWLDHIKPENIYLIDGTRLVTEPQSEYDRLSEFLNLDKKLTFKFNEDKGFYCLDQPVFQCLEASKGRSWKKDKSEDIKITFAAHFDAITMFYKEEMRLLKDLISANFPKDILENGRFKWLDDILTYQGI